MLAKSARAHDSPVLTLPRQPKDSEEEFDPLNADLNQWSKTKFELTEYSKEQLRQLGRLWAEKEFDEDAFDDTSEEEEEEDESPAALEDKAKEQQQQQQRRLRVRLGGLLQVATRALRVRCASWSRHRN